MLRIYVHIVSCTSFFGRVYMSMYKELRERERERKLQSYTDAVLCTHVNMQSHKRPLHSIFNSCTTKRQKSLRLQALEFPTWLRIICSPCLASHLVPHFRRCQGQSKHGLSRPQMLVAQLAPPDSKVLQLQWRTCQIHATPKLKPC